MSWGESFDKILVKVGIPVKFSEWAELAADRSKWRELLSDESNGALALG